MGLEGGEILIVDNGKALARLIYTIHSGEQSSVPCASPNRI